jgi:hypothetical protein
MLKTFSLQELESLDGGKAVRALDAHIKRAALDCYDRPGDKKARKVTLEIELVPAMDAEGNCDEVHAKIRAASTVPKHVTKPYSLGLRPSGQLVFSEDAPDNYRQATIMDGEAVG